MISPANLKAIRLIHLYLGVFIAPALLFFAMTGFIQTFSLHETTRGSSYVPPAILVHLSQLHKKATLTTPNRKPDAPKTPPAAAAAPKPPQAPPPAQSYHWPMKLFFAVVSIGLVTSTITGLVMAWKYNRSKAAVTAVFFAGILLPVLFLFF